MAIRIVSAKDYTSEAVASGNHRKRRSNYPIPVAAMMSCLVGGGGKSGSPGDRSLDKSEGAPEWRPQEHR